MSSPLWRFAAIAMKVALAALLVLAVLFPGWDRFADKAMDVRAVAYPVAVLLVAGVWAARGRRGAYPWDVDALLTAPFLIDVAGNAADLYDAVEWFDDACHYGNWALLAGAAGIAMRRWGGLRSWVLVLCCAGFGAITAILWELAEYAIFILDTPEVGTLYQDTVGDLVLGLLGATTAGVVLAVRKPAAPAPGEPDAEAAGRQQVVR
ncbi:hypothetical protein [Actinomadura flavalba]|uniref:hypothetical protein n=1 Tax=Actinomadura flavalba TaxID=1120938 RepID=UPI0012DD8439|nr:hypothetical protein [Actinomadura flavalba]